MLHITRDVKDLHRLERILVVFTEEGLGYYLAKAKLHSHLPFFQRVRPAFPISDKRVQAFRLRRAFERLGPTFVKLGQLLSLRPDLVPIEFSEEFAQLQDHVLPFPFSQAKKIIEEELHRPLSKIFRTFEEKPVASASIAQVHKAVLKSGQTVAVKIQRPEIKEIIDTDIDILYLIAHALEDHFPEMFNYHPVEIVKEFALWTRKELNFEIEGRNALHLREEMKNNHRVVVPRVYTNCSSQRVLTLDYVTGVRADDLTALKRYHLHQKKIALTYFTSILEQALFHGFFHADPHPANIFVQKDGKLAYLDYGIMGELSPQDRNKVIRFINSVQEKNAEKSLNIILSLAEDLRQADLAGFKREAFPILEEVYFHTMQEKSVGRAFYEIIILGTKHGVIFSANHVLVAKALYQAEGLVMKLYPQFKVAEGLDLFAKKYLRETFSPRKIASKLTKSLWEQRDLLTELPEHLSRLMERWEKPEASHELNVTQLREFEQEVEYFQHRKNLGLIASILMVASTFLFYLEGRTTILGLPLSVTLFFAALLLLFYLLLAHKKENHEGGG